MQTGRVNAPELTSKFNWLNAGKAFTLKDFRGKFVLLDFWTYGCINWQQSPPDLHRLERGIPGGIVVIGLPSSKIEGKKSDEASRKAIQKFNIKHPVINDSDFSLWRQYAINAW